MEEEQEKNFPVMLFPFGPGLISSRRVIGLRINSSFLIRPDSYRGSRNSCRNRSVISDCRRQSIRVNTLQFQGDSIINFCFFFFLIRVIRAIRVSARAGNRY
jgi:hypothetical protein